MRKIKEILRLKFWLEHSYNKISRSIGISCSTARDYVNQAKGAGITWAIACNLTDEQLESQLYSKSHKEDSASANEEAIDFSYIHKELKRKSVTLALLWQEYLLNHPDGLKYSQFCNLYRKWCETLDVWMRQPHKAGEKMFVDYAGQTMPVMSNTSTGEVLDTQIFVATCGASTFIYTEATWSQTLPDWIQSHVNAFEFFGGCPEIVVPDNLKSGVHKAHIYEPDINPTYQDMATYYGVAIIPARIASPKDKAKVENSVLQVERQILAPLRNRTFFSLSELNLAISELLDTLNNKPFQKLPGSRASQFLEIEKPALKPLPATRYEYAEWKKVKAGFNYHIEIDKHYYSVPFQLIRKDLHARYDTKVIEVFHKGSRVASHPRSYVAYGYTTTASHMPKAHQKYAEWTPERIANWAKKMGSGTCDLCETIMSSRPHPEQGYRACLGILRLAKAYGEERLELACLYAMHIGAHSYKSVESILKNKLESSATSKPLPQNDTESKAKTDSHEYIRGKDYFE